MSNVLIRFVVATLALALLGAGASIQEKSMFTAAEFAQLRFLEGRWLGQGPDESSFYEEYSFPSPTEMRSNRYPDATFTESTDGSVIALRNGQVISTWGDFTWVASEISPQKSCFVPINAPSSFCWKQVSENEVQVTQRWTDENGVAQQFVMPLRRF